MTAPAQDHAPRPPANRAVTALRHHIRAGRRRPATPHGTSCSARVRTSLLVGPLPCRSAGRRVFSLTFPVTQRDAVYGRIPALTDPAGYALVTSVEGRAKARFGVPSCITA